MQALVYGGSACFARPMIIVQPCCNALDQVPKRCTTEGKATLNLAGLLDQSQR